MTGTNYLLKRTPSASCTMEAFDMAHSDSISPTSPRMHEKFFQGWELKTLCTRTSGRHYQLGLPGLSSSLLTISWSVELSWGLVSIPIPISGVCLLWLLRKLWLELVGLYIISTGPWSSFQFLDQPTVRRTGRKKAQQYYYPACSSRQILSFQEKANRNAV